MCQEPINTKIKQLVLILKFPIYRIRSIPLIRILSLFFILSYGINSIAAQKLDSLQIINEIENFEFSNDNLRTFQKLLDKYDYKLTYEQIVKYSFLGAETALNYKNDSLYFEFSIKAISRISNGLFDTERAEILLNELQPKVEAFNNIEINSIFYSILAINYQIEGNYIEAIYNYTKSYDYYLKSNVPERARHLLFNMSAIYFTVGDNKKCIEYAKEMLLLNKYMQPEEQKANTANAYYTIHEAFNSEGQTDSALVYIKKAISLADKMDMTTNTNIFLMCCDIYMMGVQLLLTEGNNSRIDSILKKTIPCKGKADPLYSFTLAEYYLQIGAYEKVGEILRDSSLDVKEHLAFQWTKLKVEADYYEAIGQFQKAFIAQKQCLEVQQELTKEDKIRYASFADARFNLGKREEEIKNLKKINKIERHTSQLFLLSLFLLLLTLTALLFAYRKIKQNNNLLKNDLATKKKLEKQAKELSQIEQLKAHFFANIAHEFQTPLTVINGQADNLLTSEILPIKNKQVIHSIAKNSKHLSNLTTQILDVAKRKNWKEEVDIFSFQLYELLNPILSEFQIIAKEKKLQLSFGYSGFYETQLTTDFYKLKIIISNLLSNAIRYSREDGLIQLGCQVVNNVLKIQIRDTGIGIPKEALASIFDRYYQVSRAENKLGRNDGFGIGLAICKEYTDLIEGNIRVESTENKGSTFYLEIPVMLVNTKSAIKKLSTSENNLEYVSQIPDKMRYSKSIDTILIVEDNKDIWFLIQNIFKEKYNLLFKSNGEEALNYLKTSDLPNLIITDIMMPKVDGISLIKTLKSSPTYNLIPLLVISARNDLKDQLEDLNLNMDDYLLKPFDSIMLLARVAYLLEVTKNRKVVNLGMEKGIECLSKKDQIWLKQIEQMVTTSLGDFNLSPSTMATTMNISEVHLNRRLKSLTSFTASKYILETRYRKALALLENREVESVKNACYSVGFKTPKYFAKNFKKRFGKNPSDFLT